jgi:hypothetical protein
MLAVWVAGTALADMEKARDSSMAQPRTGALIQVGHEPMGPGPAYRRYTGKVTALGDPDKDGRIYSFQAMPIGPGMVPPAADEMRGWRLTMLAGKRFASMFEVKSNSATEITVDGALNGLAVSDVFIIEDIPSSLQPAQQATPQT